jgi:hypothetical protein
LQLDADAEELAEIDPENQFFDYIEGVSQDAQKLETLASKQATSAKINLTQAKTRSQYLKSKQ